MGKVGRKLGYMKMHSLEEKKEIEAGLLKV